MNLGAKVSERPEWGQRIGRTGRGGGLRRQMSGGRVSEGKK